MIFLNSLDDLVIYNNEKISNINFNNKDLKNNNLILYFSKLDESIIEFFNNEIFENNYFNNYYEENIINEEKNKKFFNIFSNHYEKIKKEVKFKINTKNNIKSFKNSNLIINLTKNFNLKDPNTKNNEAINFFFDLNKKYLNNNQFINSDKIILIDVDDNKINSSNYIKNKPITPFGCLYNFILKNNFKNLDYENVNIVIYSNKKFFKFPLNSEFLKNNKSSIISRMKTILDVCLSKNNDQDNNTKEEINNEVSEKDIEKIEKLIKIEEVNEKINDKILSRIIFDDNILNDKQKNVISKISDKIKNIIKKDNNFNKSEKEIMKILDNDKELLKDLDFLKDTVKIGKEKDIIDDLKKQQEKINLNDLNFKDIFSEMDSVITDEELDINVINNEIKKVSQVKRFDDMYINEQYEKDLMNVLTAFNDDVDIPTFVTEITTEDSSTPLDKKNTMKIKMKDSNNRTHNIKIDVPKIIDGKYIIVNGSKKIIQKQLTLKPIVKTKSDRVEITTNYIKVMVTRFGQKKTAKLNILKKIFTDISLSKYKKSPNSYKFNFGNSIESNNKYKTSLEYIDISEYLLDFETEEAYFSFNQNNLLNSINNNDLLSTIDYDFKEYFPIGYTQNLSKLLICNYKDKSVYSIDKNKKIELLSNSISTMILTLLLEHSKESLKNDINMNVKASQSFCFSRAEINNKKVPVIILLSYELGLRNVLDRYNVDWKFSSSRQNIKITEDKNVIKFKDGYLIYDSSLIRNSILLSGLNLMDTNEINFHEMEKKEPYIEFFYDIFKSRNAVKGFHNSITLMIDPITKEVLHDFGLPENIYDVFLYANTLLEDVSYNKLNDMSIYRVRGAEQINACLYQLISNSFKNYKDTSNARNPVGMSLPQNALIKKLVELPTVDEFSELNPTLEIEKMNAVTFKGLSGRNVDDAYTTEIRGFDDSMEGILAINTPDSNKVGVVRELTQNAAITNTRGYLNIEKELNGNTDIYSPGELMNVFTTTHADPPRIGMMVTQQKHIVSTAKQTPLLVGSGIEKAIPYLISDTFAVKAKDDGKIKEVDNKNKLVFLEYNDGTEDVVDLNSQQVKNSNGGFYVTQKLDLLYKEGQKFKKGDIICKNSAFFTGNSKNDISYTFGKLAKVAITSGDFTYEDSSIITESLSKDMATKVTMREELILDVNANIDYLVQIGQKVKTGDPLCIFENAFEDQSINDLLSKIGDELGSEISQLSKNTKKSHYTGTITNINIFYNRDINEFTPSVQKILKNYIKENNDKIKVINNNKNLKDTFNVKLKPIEKINSKKIKGKDVDGCMIEIYCEYNDELSVGDKISFYTSLKTIICDVIGKGEEPFSDFNKKEEIQAILSPLSIVSRMCTDLYYSLFSNKCLIELKRIVKDIFES